MTGFCYIDGMDIYATYGVVITENGYNDLLPFPTMAEPPGNDWAEHDGIEVDLSSPRLLPREIVIPFSRIGAGTASDFWGLLSAAGYRALSIPALGKIWSLRISEMPSMEAFHDAEIFTVKFIEDIPVRIANYPAANENIGFQSVLSLDDKTWDKYGIIVTGGLDELERMPSLKKTLTRTNSGANGQFYDANFVHFSKKEVTFSCCLNAAQTVDFWNLYNAFFGDLTKPGERVISYKNKIFTCYYRSSGNFRLHSLAPVVCEFDITTCIIR